MEVTLDGAMRKVPIIVLLVAAVPGTAQMVSGSRDAETGPGGSNPEADSVAVQDLGVQPAPGMQLADPLTLVGPKHLLHDYPAVRADSSVNAVIEIPAGSVDKWETDKNDGSLRWEVRDGKPRQIHYLGYLMNYGMVPRTLLDREHGGDGDPLDILVLGASLPRGTVVPVRVVAVMHMIDRGERDDKLVAVRPGTPFDAVHDLKELDQLFPGVTAILETWFSNYKGPGETETRGFGDVREARSTLEATCRWFEAKAKGS
jgi:inorganic pyrophosphatase